MAEQQAVRWRLGFSHAFPVSRCSETPVSRATRAHGSTAGWTATGGKIGDSSAEEGCIASVVAASLWRSNGLR